MNGSILSKMGLKKEQIRAQIEMGDFKDDLEEDEFEEGYESFLDSMDFDNMIEKYQEPETVEFEDYKEELGFNKFEET